MNKFTFPKESRLLTSSHFTFVFQNPKRSGTLWITLLGRVNTLGYPRFGLIVSKKYVKQAHERNRIKRLMRESFRLHKNFLFSIDFVMIARSGIATLNNVTLIEELKKLWHQYYL